MRVYAYIRCSGLGQMSGDGPERQREAITKFAESKGLEIEEWFIESVSGTKDLEDRAEFSRMRSQMLAGEVTVVVIEKLDRLARELVVQEQFVADFMKHGLELVSTMEPDLCSNEPTRKFIRQILGCTAEYEKEMGVYRMRSSRQRIRMDGGRCEGGSPYGFRVSGDKGQKRLDPIAQEQEIIALVKRLRQLGYTLRRIAAELNAKGIPSKLGKVWHAAGVRRILSYQAG